MDWKSSNLNNIEIQALSKSGTFPLYRECELNVRETL